MLTVIVFIAFVAVFISWTVYAFTSSGQKYMNEQIQKSGSTRWLIATVRAHPVSVAAFYGVFAFGFVLLACLDEDVEAFLGVGLGVVAGGLMFTVVRWLWSPGGWAERRYGNTPGPSQ